MANWFYYNENGEKISVTGKELKELAKNGTITPETFVETAEGKTGLAKHVKGLPFFETSKPETIPLATDTPSASIDSDAFGAAINAAMSNITSSPSPTKPLKSDDDIYQFLSNESTSAKPLPVSYPTESYTFTAREQAEIDKFCAEHGNDVKAVDQDGNTLLHLAAGKENIDVAVVKFIVSRGIDVNVKRVGYGDTPLYDAAFKGNVEIAKFLVSRGANVNARNNAGETPLHRAALMANTVEVIKFLISKGANANTKNNNGTTPLDVAKMVASHFKVDSDVLRYLASVPTSANPLPASYPTESYTFTAAEQVEIDKFCTKYGSNVETLIGKYGSSLLHLANSVAVAKFLVSKGIDVNGRGENGGTPLHLHALGGNTEIVEFLVSEGAKVDARDGAGTTPLQYAAFKGHIEVVKFLVSNRADVNIKNNSGNSAIDLARRDGHTGVVRYLSSPSATFPKIKETGIKKKIDTTSEWSESDKQSPSQWAGEDIGWGVAIGIAVIALLVALANQSSLAAWADMSKESAPIVILCFGGLIVFILSLIWGGTRSASKCPSCERAWAKETVNTTVLDSRRDIRDDVKVVNHFNSKGEVTGSTMIPTTKVVTVKTCRDDYRCKHCGYKWNKTYTTES